MSYEPIFDRDHKGGYSKENAFISLVQGENAYRLEDEFNESDWMSSEQGAEILRKSSPSGTVGEASDIFTDNSWFAYFKFACQTFLVNGYFVYVDRANGEDSGLNKVVIDNVPLSGTRDDLVYLEVWSEEVDHESEIRYYGCKNSPIITNNLLDNRVGGETARRIQIKSRIMVSEGNTDIETVNALGSEFEALDEFVVSDFDDNLYIASDGGSSFGEVYAFRLFISTIDDNGVIINVEDLRVESYLGLNKYDMEEYADNALDEAKAYTDLHEIKTSDTHGVGESGFESVEGAQAKADAAESNANDYTDLHEDKTVDVHGIGETGFESVEGAQAKADSAALSANEYTDVHEVKTTGIHGVGGSSVESAVGAQAKVDAHSSMTNVHQATNIATANRLILRDGSGRARVTSPSDSSDIAIKSYVDTADVNSVNTSKAYTDTHEGKANPHSGHVKKSGDTMTGVLTAQNNTGYTTFQVRNFYLSTGNPSGALGNDGDVWFKYK